MSYDRGPPKDRVPTSAGPANCKRATGRAADTATEIAGGKTQLFCSGGRNSEALLWKTLTRCCSEPDTRAAVEWHEGAPRGQRCAESSMHRDIYGTYDIYGTFLQATEVCREQHASPSAELASCKTWPSVLQTRQMHKWLQRCSTWCFRPCRNIARTVSCRRQPALL
jgi:hypothetical protein